MEQNQLMQLKGIRKERVSDILAADPALYRLKGRYLRAPGLVSRALPMAIERAPRTQLWAIILATGVCAFASSEAAKFS
jgi:hypothetical protein